MRTPSARLLEHLDILKPALHEEKEGIVLDVYVIPRAPYDSVEGLRDGRILLRVKAAPEKGKANEAVLDLIADYFDIASSNLRILRGHSSKRKSILLQSFRENR
ncbi:MAG TPA: DUF167 domain-containing protein [Rectinema sp.]|jgi:hypothetical protein|nr:DUF167 domain-containing protein [Spirochaetia bacterium]MDI9426485.1 DUF167 domain-containing protein [Spirochaetota bacterium]NLH89574.1 DUF167 domain-containing protein [Treponema sp.]OQC73905.1 MAG: hypothetical protein BWX44_01260 [Spirochaetes bacterium ADurb.Bin001]HNP92579.1 DUF167 domain-containing protein [Rectinema sp.]